MGFFNESNILEAEMVNNYKIFEEADIAIFDAEIEGAKKLELSAIDIVMGTEVSSMGFPFALNPDLKLFPTRVFKGHITSKNIWSRLASKPEIYELSFSCPKGLSGAPLITDGYTCFGMVLGNSASEMVLFEDIETIADGKVVTSHKSSQSMYLGIGLQSNFIKRYIEDAEVA